MINYNGWKPMLAARSERVDWGNFKFPMYASPKIDGIRCTVINGVPRTRSGKSFPCEPLLRWFPWDEMEGLDGELVAGQANMEGVFYHTSSVVMSKTPANMEMLTVQFLVFDKVMPTEEDIPAIPYYERKLAATNQVAALKGRHTQRIKMVEQVLVANADGLAEYHESNLAKHYEGTMVRSPVGLYKYGRSSGRSQGLVKIKEFEDAEAEIIAVIPKEVNNNESYTDELGFTKRSTRKEGKEAIDQVGSFRVRWINGEEFTVGAGLTDVQRTTLWFKRELLLGKMLKFRYMPYGVVNVPRLPTFLGIRSELDL